MGCTESKLDGLQAVALCRDRSQYIARVISHRQAFAAAHAAYVHSLRSVGVSLHHFFILPTTYSNSFRSPFSASPVLTLPTRRKKDDTFSNSGSHIPFHPSDDEFSDDGYDQHFTSDRFSYSYPIETVVSTTAHLNFARRDAPFASTVTYEQRPFNPKTFPVNVGVFDGYNGFDGDYNFGRHNGGGLPSGFTYHYNGGHSYTNQVYQYPTDDLHGSANSNVFNFYESYQHPTAYGVTGNGYFGSSSIPPVAARRRSPLPSPSSSSRFRVLPSSPKASTWDFLNPFDSYQGYSRIYTPSWSSREVREMEGIPDLEEDEHVIVKEMCGDKKFEFLVNASTSVSHVDNSCMADICSSSCGHLGRQEDCRSSSIGDERHQHCHGKASSSSIGDERHQHCHGKTSSSSIGDERHQRCHGKASRVDGSRHYKMQDKCFMDDEIHLQEYGEEEMEEVPVRLKVIPGSRSVLDAVQEIKTLFDRASMSCKEVSKILDSGRFPQSRRKNDVISFTMMRGITPTLSKATSSQHSLSKSEENSLCSSSGHLDLDKMMTKKAGSNLLMTLQKLYVWEKKLHEEVKAEEKMRILHEKKCKQLKCLTEKGEETQKIEDTRALVKKLSTKIRIAIKFINSISNKLHKLRDDELWPHINELIHGLVRMWQGMMDCHRSQIQTITEAKNMDAILSAYTGRSNDTHMDVTVQLLMQMLDWMEAFSGWIRTEKSYVKALNSWLQKCLLCEPSAAPLSPAKLGAPPIFVICNHWSEIMDRISEKEVVEAMQAFTGSVLQVWQQHYYERRQMMLESKEMDKMLKALDREDQKIHKAIQAANKRCLMASNDYDFLPSAELLHLSHISEPNNLKLGLKRICEAMERFTGNSMNAYQELCSRCDEEMATKEHINVD